MTAHVGGGPTRVLALDVDGTLCTRGSPPSSYVLDTLAEAARSDWHIILCTGRQYIGVEDIIQRLALSSPQVVSDGALLVAPDGSEIWKAVLTPDLVRQAVRTARKYGVTIVLGGDGRTAAERWNQDVEYMLSFGDPEPQIVPDLTAFDGFEPTIALLVDRQQSRRLVAAQSALAKSRELSVRASAPGYVSAVQRGVSKASGLRMALETCKIDRESAVIVAMGDAPNDIPLFAMADFSVAMADSAPEVQGAATERALGVEDDGVAWAVKRLLAGQFKIVE